MTTMQVWAHIYHNLDFFFCYYDHDQEILKFHVFHLRFF